MAFEGFSWQAVGFELIAQRADAVFCFTPEAFCYYLPGLMAAGLREGRTDSNAYDAMIGCLDRSPEPAYWDEFLAPRWTLLSAAEVDAVGAWSRWLKTLEPEAFQPNTYERIRAMLAVCSQYSSAAQ